MSPNATSMTIPACIDYTTIAKQVVTFFGDQPHRGLVPGLDLHLSVPLVQNQTPGQ